MGTTFSEPGKAMRSNLTFLGFLRQYVKELSGESILSIKRLASCCGDFPKLREPLFLYAVFSGQLQTLRSALQAESNESLQKLCDDFGDIVTLDILQKKLSICGLSLKKMQKSPFQNHFRQTESLQSPDESSHSLEYPLKNGSVRYKKALLSPSGLMSLLKKKTSTYHKFSRKRSRKNARLTIITQRNGTLAIAPLLFQVQQFRF